MPVTYSKKRKSSQSAKKSTKKIKTKKLDGRFISPTLKSNFKNTMVYFDMPYSLNPGVGTAAVQAMSLNGLYDPDVSGIGHQPTGFDQLDGMYSQYLVRKAFVKAHFTNTDTTAAQIVGICITTDAAPGTDVRKFVENGNCVTSIVAPAGSGESVKTLTFEYDLSKIAGYNVEGDSDYAGTASGSPAQQVYALIFAAGMTTGDPSFVYAAVEVRYDVEWRRPILESVS